MATLSLKISVVGNNVVKTMQFEPSTIVYDACKIIRDRIDEIHQGNGKCTYNYWNSSLQVEFGFLNSPKDGLTKRVHSYFDLTIQLSRLMNSPKDGLIKRVDSYFDLTIQLSKLMNSSKDGLIKRVG